jgi:ATP-dependent helicase HrpA
VAGEARGEDITDALLAAVDELAHIGAGDILVFLPGEREIREAAEALRKHHPSHTEILPLFSRLSAAEQERVFKPSGARRIVLATNVAETSLTVPGIRYVVDTGVARVKRYSYRNKVEQLQIEPISQAAANQRAGRCGRVASGVCIRLYDEADFASRPRFSDPEILRSSLASVILRMKALGLGEVSEFPFLEPPAARAIADGYQLLTELNAVNEEQALTEIGREIARLPLDPRIARMMLAARECHCLSEMLIIAAALSVQDARERPLEAQGAADAAHKRLADERSEFMGDLRLWHWYQEALAHKKSQRQLRDTCKQNFLSPLRLREWLDVERQLHANVAEMGWRINTVPATYEQLHLALLTGLLGNVGLKSETEAHFVGARGIKFFIWPGSVLAKKPGRWVVAAELMETSRLYARTVAKIEPQWLEKVGAHLIRTSVGEPHWEKSSGRVVAMQRGTLYGLPVYQQRRIDFATIDPVRARSCMIRDGIVSAMHGENFEARSAAVRDMMANNQRLIADIERLEHKTRRPDVLVDDELLVAICDHIIPAEVTDQRLFERWFERERLQNPGLLRLSREDLMRHDAAGVTSDNFPRSLEMGGIAMALDYHFEPGSPRDGVTLEVPIYALNQIDAARAEWLVPGMLKEKVSWLVKSLPQRIRRHAVPLPNYVDGFLARNGDAPPRVGLLARICSDFRETLGVTVHESDFKAETVPLHLSMNFRVTDASARQLAMGRNLAALRAELGQEAQRQFQEAFQAARGKNALSLVRPDADTERAALQLEQAQAPLAQTRPRPFASAAVTDWNFEELPELLEIERDGQTLIGYPALVDHKTYCQIEVFDEPEQARLAHRLGLMRLFALQLKEPLKFISKNLPQLNAMAMQYMPLGTIDELREQIILAALERACLQEPWPQDQESFAARLKDARTRVSLVAQEIVRQTALVLNEYHGVQRKLPLLRGAVAAHSDVESQLKFLMQPDFVLATPAGSWPHLPRYLQAVSLRIDKLKADPERDKRLMAEITPLEVRWRRALDKRRGQADRPLADFGWLLQELRVALFAQELRTPMPVSVKRLQRVWESIER